ncbi:MAG: hypothetical protein LBR29_06700 [Methylobacteriaceae bacterium]|jgi:hypothetical protein|nr:hypothetical protein [Methylobacteriaceae bacterium]
MNTPLKTRVCTYLSVVRAFSAEFWIEMLWVGALVYAAVTVLFLLSVLFHGGYLFFIVITLFFIAFELFALINFLYRILPSYRLDLNTVERKTEEG